MESRADFWEFLLRDTHLASVATAQKFSKARYVVVFYSKWSHELAFEKRKMRSTHLDSVGATQKFLKVSYVVVFYSKESHELDFENFIGGAHILPLSLPYGNSWKSALYIFVLSSALSRELVLRISQIWLLRISQIWVLRISQNSALYSFDRKSAL